MNKDEEYFFKDSPQQYPRNDFWRQVNRTIDGEPVGEDQILMLIESIRNGVELKSSDVVLDLCCGNGAITSQIASDSQYAVGVDFSEYLIGIAQEFFQGNSQCQFVYENVIEFCDAPSSIPFSKAYCYGASSYLTDEQLTTLLLSLHKNFGNITHFFIGNCPDKQFKQEFFKRRGIVCATDETPQSAIGIWRHQDELIAIAKRCGWNAKVSKMPDTYHAAYYKFDLILTRK